MKCLHLWLWPSTGVHDGGLKPLFLPHVEVPHGDGELLWLVNQASEVKTCGRAVGLTGKCQKAFGSHPDGQICG
jgi:hypothetical protein